MAPVWYARLMLPALENIKDILAQNDIIYAGLFGSRARGDERPGSDYDILVKLNKPIGLFGLVGLQIALEERLHGKVDLVTEDAISPLIRETVAHDLQVFYGQK